MTIKALVKVTNQLTFHVDEESEVELFKSLARAQELFDHTECGVCKSKNIKYVCRKDKDDNDWLELVCQEFKCRAKLSFGQTKKGGQIFPKVRWNQLSETNQAERPEDEKWAEEHKGWLPKKGWYVYKGNK